jgi:protein-tyrosine phosphatase
MVDLHSHILPGIDDGASDVDEMQVMLSIAAESGIRKIVATPHINEESSDAYLDLIQKKYNELKETIAREYEIELVLGGEILIYPEISDDLDRLKPFLFAGDSMLLECRFINKPYAFKDIIFALKMKGIRVILAHPERYRWMEEDAPLLDYLLQNGVLMQLDAGSLNGVFSKRAQQFARRMLAAGQVHFIASDAHNTGSRSFSEMAISQQYLSKKYDTGLADLLLHKNPDNLFKPDSDILTQRLTAYSPDSNSNPILRFYRRIVS